MPRCSQLNVFSWSSNSLGLAFFARRSHNAGDVGLSFLFQEGIVAVGGRNLCRVVAEIDDLLTPLRPLPGR